MDSDLMLSEYKGVEEEELHQMTWKEQMKSVFELSIKKRMLKLMPQIIWTGLSIAMFSSLLTEIINDSIKPDPNKSDDENDKD